MLLLLTLRNGVVYITQTVTVYRPKYLIPELPLCHSFYYLPHLIHHSHKTPQNPASRKHKNPLTPPFNAQPNSNPISHTPFLISSNSLINAHLPTSTPYWWNLLLPSYTSQTHPHPHLVTTTLSRLPSLHFPSKSTQKLSNSQTPLAQITVSSLLR